MVDLDTGELKWLANHLAHDVNTHENFYKKHDTAVELAKVSKLLLLAERGKVAKYTGKKLSEIDIEGELP